MSLPELFAHPALTVIPLATHVAVARHDYESILNIALNRINESCLRIAAFEGDYRWHYHSSSDELFIVVHGLLEIDLSDGSTLRLSPWDAVTIPAGTVHRTRAAGRTVNLTFEHLVTDTVMVDPPTANATP